MWAIGHLLWASHDTPGFILSNGHFGVQLGVCVMVKQGYYHCSVFLAVYFLYQMLRDIA